MPTRQMSTTQISARDLSWRQSPALSHRLSVFSDRHFKYWMIAPAILVLPIESVDERYFAWIMGATTPPVEV